MLVTSPYPVAEGFTNQLSVKQKKKNNPAFVCSESESITEQFHQVAFSSSYGRGGETFSTSIFCSSYIILHTYVISPPSRPFSKLKSPREGVPVL